MINLLKLDSLAGRDSDHSHKAASVRQGEVRNSEQQSGVPDSNGLNGVLHGSFYAHSGGWGPGGNPNHQLPPQIEADVILQYMADALLVMDVDGRILYVNPAWERLSGHNAPDMIRSNARLLEIDGASADVLHDMRAVLRTGATWRGIMRGKRRSGEYYETEAVVAPILDAAGNLIRMVSVQRELDATFARARQHIAETTHDLAGPLSSVRLWLGMLRRSPEQSAKALLIIEHQVERLDVLVKDLHGLARLDTDQMHLQRRATDLRDVVSRVVDSQLPLARSKGQILGYDAPANPVMALIDPNELERALVNLVVNALNYTPAGGAIFLELGYQGNDAFVAVQDTGIGIPTDSMPHLFERHYRGEAAQRMANGNGLGLVIAHDIVSRHEGRIYVNSTPNEGSTFTIYIPRLKE